MEERQPSDKVENEGNQYDSYTAQYCENCGRLFEASDEIEGDLEEPVHRVDIIEAIGPIDEVGETVAMELGECECTGQVVKRWYAHPAGHVPETGYAPDEDQLEGRDPDEDALIDLGDEWQEVREVPGIEEGSDL